MTRKGVEQSQEDAANAAGYRYFTEAERFRDYVRREVLGLEATGE